MSTLTVERFAEEINERSAEYEIGRLQHLRVELHGGRRAGSNIFSDQTIREDWAFHHGGRTELQFNIGYEPVDGKEHLRFGVAFSLEPSRSLPSIDVLIPKIALFNEFVLRYPKAVAGLHMWDWFHGVRSPARAPGPIDASLVKQDAFIFLGGVQPSDGVDFHHVLSTLDSLLPLYKFVESSGKAVEYRERGVDFRFRAGYSARKRSTIATYVERELSVDLRHNALQQLLYDQLCKEYGKENVGTELANGIGGRIDAVVKTDKGCIFYEIKVGKSLQGCIREALGQLLEYSYWPGAIEAVSLVVVGEAPLDEPCSKYLELLNDRLKIPVTYSQLLCD